MKLSRAWHLLIDANGNRDTHNGRPLTVGVDHDGRLWLFGDPIGGGGLLLGDDAAAWLSRTLSDALGGDPRHWPTGNVADDDDFVQDRHADLDPNPDEANDR